MQTLSTKLQGPVLLAPTVHGDERGFFVESFRQSSLPELTFVQDNHSRSRQGVVRGMHFQPGQVKLVRCARGAILDVIVDIRRYAATTSTTTSCSSPTASPTASASSRSWPT